MPHLSVAVRPVRRAPCAGAYGICACACSLVNQLTSATRSHAHTTMYSSGREMGAVLWSIFALIFVLLSQSNASREDRADIYAEQLLAANRRGKRSDHDELAGCSWTYQCRGWNCEKCIDNSTSNERMLEGEFIANISTSVQSIFQQFRGPLLVHTVSLHCIGAEVGGANNC